MRRPFSRWLANSIAPSAALGPKFRWLALRLAGVDVGRARIEHGGTYAGDLTKLRIEAGVYLNTGVSLHPTGGLTIGRNVSCGPRVIIMTGSHEIGIPARRASEPTIYSAVHIGDGAWLGAGVLVSPGVTIGSGCVIAPGAVVTRDCEPDGLYGGVPARRIRDL